jgi:hypothetical protein
VRTVENDVELIVTPQNYDSWLPKPGQDQMTAGSIMNVSLKLQGRNGTTTNKKAKSFELRLSNTSREPGITINFPINSTNLSADLKFMQQPNSLITDTASQSMVILCRPSRQTADLKIGAFDGGGWTILNAEAILDDDTRVQGRLLVSNGDVDIRIPRREPNSKIAKAWLTANGNPDEMEDKEISRGNNNNGDGFTAYEEYRGVIAEGEYKRLDPKKKEVGVEATQTDFSLFSTGISWFESAGDIKVVRFDFDKDEIARDSRLNMNARSGHDYDQYALYLLNGGLKKGTLGMVYTKNNKPDIPAQIISVVINWEEVQTAYRQLINTARPEMLKFIQADYLAQTVAHELGHAVNIWHHGRDSTHGPWVVNDISDRNRIFDRSGHLITNRPYELSNIGDSTETVEGGNISCMLNYYPYYSWGYTRGADGANIFNQEPLIPLGKTFCKSKSRTGFNARHLYFGDAAKGNCLSQIKLRN